jgi:hypothetical protein
MYYTKYFKTRITEPFYKNLELEIELIKHSKTIFGINNAQNMIDMIVNIAESTKYTEYINNRKTKITSEVYKPFSNVLNNNKVNPIIIDKHSWNINTDEATIEYDFPPELEYYIVLCQKLYPYYQSELNNTNDSVTEPQIGKSLKHINTMGIVVMETELNKNKYELTMNMFQALVLNYLNYNEYISETSYLEKYAIDKKLLQITLDSLENANLIIDASDQKYYINKNFGYDNNKINLVNIFSDLYNEITAEDVVEDVTEDIVEYDKLPKQATYDISSDEEEED